MKAEILMNAIRALSLLRLARLHAGKETSLPILQALMRLTGAVIL